MTKVDKINAIGVSFIFHEKYLEIVDRTGFGGFLMPKKVTIMYQNIASVDANIATGRLIIETAGGKTFKYNTGFSAQKIKDKILSYL